MIAACTLEALRGCKDAFIEAVHRARGHSGQVESANRIRVMMHTDEDPSDLEELCAHNVQDAYSMRCSPQVHGTAHDILKYVWTICRTELNAATDNPLVMPDGALVSAGNFHGEYPGKAADYLAIGISELAQISERRIERMLNPSLSGPSVKLNQGHLEMERSPTSTRADSSIHLSMDNEMPTPRCCAQRSDSSINLARGNEMGREHTYNLPAFLMPKGTSGLNSGFMIPHCTAAALVSENKTLVHPATCDNISTSAAQEDHVSMGTWASLKCLRVVANVDRVLGIELMAACQALDLTGMRSTRKCEAIKRMVRSRVAFWQKDEIAYLGQDACYALLRQGRILEAAAGAIPNGKEILSLTEKCFYACQMPIPMNLVPTVNAKGVCFVNATVLTMAGAVDGRKGRSTALKIGPKSMNDIGLRNNHAVLVGPDGNIKKVCSTKEMHQLISVNKMKGLDIIDCKKKVLMPGLVDGHTHAVHAGDRSQEMAAKMRGESFQSVTKRGDGIHFTGEATRRATQKELE